jgi:hypothetical protein
MLPHQSAFADDEGGRRCSVYTDDGENSHRVGNHLRLHVPDAKAKLMVQRAKHEPDENDATTSGASTAETRAHQSLTLHAIEKKSDGNVLRPARPTPGTHGTQSKLSNTRASRTKSSSSSVQPWLARRVRQRILVGLV